MQQRCGPHTSVRFANGHRGERDAASRRRGALCAARVTHTDVDDDPAPLHACRERRVARPASALRRRTARWRRPADGVCATAFPAFLSLRVPSQDAEPASRQCRRRAATCHSHKNARYRDGAEQRCRHRTTSSSLDGCCVRRRMARNTRRFARGAGQRSRLVRVVCVLLSARVVARPIRRGSVRSKDRVIRRRAV
jgi:hypothetical protein